MKRLIMFFGIVAMIACAMSAKNEEKEYQDSIDAVMASQSVDSQSFLIVVNRMTIRAHSWYVADNTNFLAVGPKRGMVQIVPEYGTFDGLNLEGNISGYKVKTKKKGDKIITFQIKGVNLSAKFQITLYRESNDVAVLIMPNFSSGQISMYGKLFSLDVFPSIEKEL